MAGAGRTLAEQAAALLDELDQRSRMPQGAQHRRSQRLRYRHVLELAREQEGMISRSLAYSRDISAGGIGCLHFEPIPLKTPLRLRLVSAGDQTLEVAARVVHCRHAREDWWLLGLAFDELIDPLDFV